jgi:hypothetical protein
MFKPQANYDDVVLAGMGELSDFRDEDMGELS